MFAGDGNSRPNWAGALHWLAASAGVLALAACAARSPIDEARAPRAETAYRTFAEGYRQISERYLEPVTVESLALEGLNGLDSIDPRIGFKRSETYINLFYDGRLAHTEPVALPLDSDGWSRITMQALADARAVSPAIRGAPDAQIYEAVFDGMLSKLDPFSRYAGAEEARENRAKRRGFGGVGVEFVLKPAGAEIVTIFPGTPAARIGLAEGDVIARIDDAQVTGMDEHQVRDRLRGTIGSRVALDIMRPGRPRLLAFDVERAKVVLPTVTAAIAGGVLHLVVSGFNHSTATRVAEEVNRARAQGRIEGIVLDLRSNPGGLLIQAVKVSDLFLAAGRIVSTRGRHPSSSRDYDAHDIDIAAGLPMVVLINGRSASASEIVAAALQDNDRAIVIGTASFGKGTVQTITRLPNDGEMTLTWSRFIAPSGYAIHHLGLTPSVCTNLAAASVAQVIDNALDHAAGIAERLEQWRMVPYGNLAERQRLRRLCPATSGKRKLEQLVADRILTEPSLYHQVMAMDPALTASRR